MRRTVRQSHAILRSRLAELSFGLVLGACSTEAPAPSDNAAGNGAAPAQSPADEGANTTGAAAVTQGLARRLTRDEYRYSVLDALGVEVDENSLPSDVPKRGFTNNASGLLATSEHVTAYHQVAKEVVSSADFAKLENEHGSCPALDVACTGAFVGSLGESLFRRPLDQREVASFGALFERARSEGATFGDGARLVLRAILQAPQFLYRLEAQRTGSTGTRRVSGFELASRLSYWLWASLPDAELRRAAGAGELDTHEGVRNQVERLLATRERTGRSLRLFARDFALQYQLATTAREGVTPALASSYEVSLAATFEQHAWLPDQPLSGVFRTRSFVLDAAVAQHIGISAADTELAPYDLSALPDRVGLLTHPGLLTAISSSDGGGMVTRGLYVMEQLLCGAPLAPPAGLNTQDFVSHLGPGATDRDYAEDRGKNPACAGCHAQFDPLAFALERFDGAGRHRLQSEHGKTLRSDGELVTGSGRFAYASVSEYANLLAEAAEVRACLTRRLAEFALGESLEDDAVEALQQVQQQTLEGGGTYAALVGALAQSSLFSATVTE
jgi:hypothetical protein